MRRAVLYATLLFWVGMGAVWIAAAVSPGGAPAARTESGSSAAPPPQDQRPLTAGEVRGHNTAKSCWLIIGGKVYDVTGYIGRHPANPETILKYCGKEATQGFETKDRGRPHSAAARNLLERFLLGPLSVDEKAPAP